MRNIILHILVCTCLCTNVAKLTAMPLYDQGRLELDGVQLFQDHKNSKEYYYLPTNPRLSLNKHGLYEFTCINYIASNVEQSGGMFHALVQYSISPDELKILEQKLSDKVPGAVIKGPVELQEDVENTNPSFRLLSSVLDSKDSVFLSTTITSGKAPFLPGSKVAISSLLNTSAAALLWESFQSNTSDVSFVIEGFFPALVTGFTANVNADLNQVYQHFSDRRDTINGNGQLSISNTLDSLASSGIIKIEVIDKGKALGIETDIYKDLLNLITEKIITLLFNKKDGWVKMSSLAQEETSNQSALAGYSDFGGNGRYEPKAFLFLKDRKQLKSFAFNLRIDQSISIKVPVYSAGNLGGFYKSSEDNNDYFKVVYMDDPAYQSRDIHFQIEGENTDCFEDAFDNASIRIRKKYSDTLTVPYESILQFNKSRIDSGELIQKCRYQRLSEAKDSWLDYEYQVAWVVNNVDTVITTDWITTQQSSNVISSPLTRRQVLIDSEASLLEEKGVQTVRIRFGIKKGGKQVMTKAIALRKSDSFQAKDLVFYHDKNAPIVYQVNWYTKDQEVKDELKLLEDDFLILTPNGI